MASEISPTVALARVASIASARRLPVPDSAACLIAEIAVVALFSSLSCLRVARRASCPLNTAALSISRISTLSSLSEAYLLTPTITSSPLSIKACFLAAASSILSLGMPVSIACAMPPRSSTSSISDHARSAMELVRDSII